MTFLCTEFCVLNTYMYSVKIESIGVDTTFFLSYQRQKRNKNNGRVYCFICTCTTQRNKAC